MVAYVTFHPKDSPNHNERRWHIGNNFVRDRVDPADVVSVQADGDELERILHICTNLPNAPKKRVVEWYGDHARFIVCNVMMEP